MIDSRIKDRELKCRRARSRVNSTLYTYVHNREHVYSTRVL